MKDLFKKILLIILSEIFFITQLSFGIEVCTDSQYLPPLSGNSADFVPPLINCDDVSLAQASQGIPPGGSEGLIFHTQDYGIPVDVTITDEDCYKITLPLITAGEPIFINLEISGYKVIDDNTITFTSLKMEGVEYRNVKLKRTGENFEVVNGEFKIKNENGEVITSGIIENGQITEFQSSLIMEQKEFLSNLGYFKGVIDETLTDEYRLSLIKFQSDLLKGVIRPEKVMEGYDFFMLVVGEYCSGDLSPTAYAMLLYSQIISMRKQGEEYDLKIVGHVVDRHGNIAKIEGSEKYFAFNNEEQKTIFTKLLRHKLIDKEGNVKLKIKLINNEELIFNIPFVKFFESVDAIKDSLIPYSSKYSVSSNHEEMEIITKVILENIWRELRIPEVGRKLTSGVEIIKNTEIIYSLLGDAFVMGGIAHLTNTDEKRKLFFTSLKEYLAFYGQQISSQVTERPQGILAEIKQVMEDAKENKFGKIKWPENFSLARELSYFTVESLYEKKDKLELSNFDNRLAFGFLFDNKLVDKNGNVTVEIVFDSQNKPFIIQIPYYYFLGNFFTWDLIGETVGGIFVSDIIDKVKRGEIGYTRHEGRLVERVGSQLRYTFLPKESDWVHLKEEIDNFNLEINDALNILGQNIKPDEIVVKEKLEGNEIDINQILSGLCNKILNDHPGLSQLLDELDKFIKQAEIGDKEALSSAFQTLEAIQAKYNNYQNLFKIIQLCDYYVQNLASIKAGKVEKVLGLFDITPETTELELMIYPLFDTLKEAQKGNWDKVATTYSNAITRFKNRYSYDVDWITGLIPGVDRAIQEHHRATAIAIGISRAVNFVALSIASAKIGWLIGKYAYSFVNSLGWMKRLQESASSGALVAKEIGHIGKGAVKILGVYYDNATEAALAWDTLLSLCGKWGWLASHKLASTFLGMALRYGINASIVGTASAMQYLQPTNGLWQFLNNPVGFLIPATEKLGNLGDTMEFVSCAVEAFNFASGREARTSLLSKLAEKLDIKFIQRFQEWQQRLEIEYIWQQLRRDLNRGIEGLTQPAEELGIIFYLGQWLRPDSKARAGTKFAEMTKEDFIDSEVKNFNVTVEGERKNIWLEIKDRNNFTDEQLEDMKSKVIQFCEQFHIALLEYEKQYADTGQLKLLTSDEMKTLGLSDSLAVSLAVAYKALQATCTVGGQPLNLTFPQLLAAYLICQGYKLEVEKGDGDFLKRIINRVLNVSTGEGKTYIEPVAAAALALLRKDGNKVFDTVFVAFPNDILCRRDYKGKHVGNTHINMDKFYELLGLEAVLMDDYRKGPPSKKPDIIYTTIQNAGFYILSKLAEEDFSVFDSLRRMAMILDEVDSTAIEQAQSPLIVSLGGGEYYRGEIGRFFRGEIGPFLRDLDAHLQGKKLMTQEEILERKVELIKHIYQLEDLIMFENELGINTLISCIMNAENIINNYRDSYIIHTLAGGRRIIIVSELSFEAMVGQTWQNWIHQMIEAYEGLDISVRSSTAGVITLFDVFQQLGYVTGLSGTTFVFEELFKSLLGADVLSLPEYFTDREKLKRQVPAYGYKDYEMCKLSMIESVIEHALSGESVVFATLSYKDMFEKVKDHLIKRGGRVIDEEKYDGELIYLKISLPNGKTVELQRYGAKEDLDLEKKKTVEEKAGKAGMITVSSPLLGRGIDIVAEQKLYVVTDGLMALWLTTQILGRAWRGNREGAAEIFFSTDLEKDPTWRRYNKLFQNHPEWLEEIYRAVESLNLEIDSDKSTFSFLDERIQNIQAIHVKLVIETLTNIIKLYSPLFEFQLNPDWGIRGLVERMSNQTEARKIFTEEFDIFDVLKAVSGDISLLRKWIDNPSELTPFYGEHSDIRDVIQRYTQLSAEAKAMLLTNLDGMSPQLVFLKLKVLTSPILTPHQKQKISEEIDKIAAKMESQGMTTIKELIDERRITDATLQEIMLRRLAQGYAGKYAARGVIPITYKTLVASNSNYYSLLGLKPDVYYEWLFDEARALYEILVLIDLLTSVKP